MSHAKSSKYEVHLKTGKVITMLATRVSYSVPDEYSTLLTLYRGNTCVYVVPLDKVDHVINPEHVISQGGELVGLNRIRDKN